MKIAVVAVDGMFDSGLSVVLDVLSSANALRSDVCGAPPPIEVTVVGLGESVTTGHGLRIHTTPAHKLAPAPDVVVMPAPGVKESHHVIGLVAGHPILSWINRVAEQGTALAAACTGTFFLAEAGVLDGRRATTSWWLGPAFRKRYRAVDLNETSTLVHDGRVTTAGAAFAHIDLALSIVRHQSPALAELVSRHLLIGDRPSQAAFAIPSMLAGADPVMTAFELWIRRNLADPLPLKQVAGTLGVSERTLQRVTASVVGMSPMDFVHEIRLDQATFLLRTTTMSAEAIARAVGYQHVGTLRALIRRRRGSTLTSLRSGAHHRPENIPQPVQGASRS
jgi:transcriptional regulator GlxA family with amidase domain